jgi:D-alanine-D-alanine ligase
MKTGRVGVLAGGPSNERDISLRSGRAVYNALAQEGIDVFFVDVMDNIYDIIKAETMDAAFLALHGKFGEDGTVQKILDSAGIRYSLALDKIASKEVFVQGGICTPEYFVADKDEWYHCDEVEGRRSNVEARLLRHFMPRNDGVWLPLAVKPQFEGSSIGLSVVREKADLKQAMDSAFRYGSKVILEEYIVGRELTVGILGDEPLPVLEIVPKDRVYDYRAKYTDPDTQYLVPAPITECEAGLAQSQGLRAHEALGCKSFSRVDMMMDASGKIFVLEVNTIPGMTERSLLPKAAGAAGVSFNKLCVKLIEDALR